MKNYEGMGTGDRERLSAVLRASAGTITVDDATEILALPRTQAAKLLARWAGKGWLARVQRGVYIPVPLESPTSDVPLDDAWVVASRIYEPCYVGGWSAAEYWGLTEQIFRTLLVFTVQQPRNRNPVLQGSEFLLRTVPESALFGLKAVWRGGSGGASRQVKVLVSDPSRTVLDLLNAPQLGGGLRSSVDMLENYLASDKKDLPRLFDYACQLQNGAVFKRLGFLLETLAPAEKEMIAQCKLKMSQGNSRLDPKLTGGKLVTRWRLWVPEVWKLKNLEQ